MVELKKLKSTLKTGISTHNVKILMRLRRRRMTSKKHSVCKKFAIRGFGEAFEGTKTATMSL